MFPDTPQRDFLRGSRYTNVLIEVMYVSSATANFSIAPNKADLEYLRQKILHYCNKTNVVVAVDDPIPYSHLSTILWETDALKAFEKRHGLYSSVGDTLVLRILYMPGTYLPSQITRGLAYGDYAFCMFKQQIADSRERSVMLHEFGHILGLVNCGTKCQTPHEEQDSAHKPHCNNEKGCVMYYSSPDTQTPDFDEACQRDLKANGGR